MCSGGLWHFVVWLRFYSMHEIRKLDRILNKNGHIVTHQIPVTFFGIKFRAKPRTSRTVSAEPLKPTTVEKRTNTGVFFEGSLKILALQRSGIAP